MKFLDKNTPILVQELKPKQNVEDKKGSNCSFSVFFSQITTICNTFILLYQIQALRNKIENLYL